MRLAASHGAFFDARGSLLKVTDPLLRETLYEYDELGRLKKGD